MAGPRVVVVGGGPCGTTLARLLARAGWAVTLVEAAEPGAPRPYRGEGLMPSGVAALEAMGLWPLPPPVRHRPLGGWAVVLERRPFFAVAEPLAGDRGCWLVDQVSLLAHLRGELVGQGVRVLEGRAVRGLLRAAEGGDARQWVGGAGPPRPRADGPRGRVTGVVLADGTELAADLVVACEGRASPLRRQAGLTLQGEGAGQGGRAEWKGQGSSRRTGSAPSRADQPWLREGPDPSTADQEPLLEGPAPLGADQERLREGERQGGRGGEQVFWFRLAGAAVAPLARWLAGRFLTVVGEGLSFALFAEAGGEVVRLGWVAEAGVAPPGDGAGWRELWAAALPEEGAALLRQLPVAAIEGPQRFPVRVGWAPRWHTPGFLLLGDAAHPMSPVRAQGINMALRDALVAARLLGPLAGQAADAAVGDAAAPEARLETLPVARDPAAAMDEAQRRMDGLLPRIAARRLPEIRRMQALQAGEAELGARLRQLGWLRRGLAATAPWSGRLARLRWIQQQHRLRQGLPGVVPLPE